MIVKEWIVIGGVLGFMLTLMLFAKLSEETAKKILNNCEEKIEKELTITVFGEVVAPGSYRCRPGLSLKEFLSNIELTPNADRKKITRKKILFSSQEIKIPAKKRRFSEEKKNRLEEN